MVPDARQIRMMLIIITLSSFIAPGMIFEKRLMMTMTEDENRDDGHEVEDAVDKKF